MTHFRGVLLLITIYFVAAANVTLATMAARSDNTPLACLRIGFKSSDSDERVLRTARDDEEERGFTTSNFEKAKSLFSSSKLSQESLQRWAKLGKTPDKVFLRLKLDKAGVKLLDKPNFLVWVKYVDDFNAQNSAGMTASMVSILTTHYGDDGLAKILVAAKAAPDTKDIATKLLAEQSQRWLSGGKSADAVFALLGLDSGVKKLLESKVLSVWIDYMKLFNSANPDEKASVITTFTKAYGDLRLAKMLDAAATVSTTARIAKRVQTEQIQRWIGDKRSPDDIFLLLKLKDAGDKLLENPLLNTWERFLVAFNFHHPDQKATVISTLTNHYGDKKLAEVFIAASKVPSTKKVAKQLQTVQLGEWLRAKMDPEHVRKMLTRKAGKAEKDLSKLYDQEYRRVYPSTS